MIGVQVVAGGLVALLVLVALTALTTTGLAVGAHSIATRRYKRALLTLGPSLLVGGFVSSGWLALFASTPERDLAIDFRKEIATDWIAATFPHCRLPPSPSITACDSSGYINRVRLTLPDGIELQTTTKMMSVSFSPKARRLTSVSMVVHPYMAAVDVIPLHSSLTTKLAKDAANSAAATKKVKDVEIWLNEWRESSGSGVARSSDNYVCMYRDSYDFCLRYRHSSFGQGFTVTYEVSAKR